MNTPNYTENSPAMGNVFSAVLFIGQSLCTQCMRVQEPFYGHSGRLLDKMFTAVGIKKHDILISNIVHCHPHNNRSSRASEVDACGHFLLEEISLMPNLELIIALGLDSAAWCVSQPLPEKGYRVLHMYHPAYIYRMAASLNSTASKDYVEKGVTAISRFIGGWTKMGRPKLVINWGSYKEKES